MKEKEFAWGWVVCEPETGIAEHRFKPGTLIDVPLLLEAKTYRERTFGNSPHYTLAIANIGVDATDDAKELTLDSAYLRNIRARAIVVNQLAERLLINFYLRINRPPVETKLFSRRDEAVQWLLSLDRLEK